MVSRDELAAYVHELLAVDAFQDYCPNGLQVEGRGEIRRIAAAVTASQAVIDAALTWGADALLVHHGYFWKREAAPLTGIKGRRIRTLMRHDLNLFAWHLPLDAHPELGNNAVWGAAMGWRVKARFGAQELGCLAPLDPPCTAAELAARLQRVLAREPLWLPGDGRPVRTVAWCSGGAQDWFADAIAAGADAFVTGEVSEPCYHLAKESGVHFFAAGHHATERFGIRALARHLAERFSLEWTFLDEENPV